MGQKVFYLEFIGQMSYNVYLREGKRYLNGNESKPASFSSLAVRVWSAPEGTVTAHISPRCSIEGEAPCPVTVLAPLTGPQVKVLGIYSADVFSENEVTVLSFGQVSCGQIYPSG